VTAQNIDTWVGPQKISDNVSRQRFVSALQMVAYGKLSRLWSACSNMVRIPTSFTDYREWVANISHCQ